MRLRRWTQAEIDYLVMLYPDHSNAYISEYLHRSVKAIQLKALEVGVRKNPELYGHLSAKNRFKKGHIPFNKGRKRETFMSEEGRRKCAMTHFKLGVCRDDNPRKRQVGFEILRSPDKCGRRYWWIKPDNGRMMPKHRWLWEQAYGAIPKGHCVQFLDGDTTNCVLDNLYLISRARQVRKNFDDLPEERKAETRAKIHENRNKSIRRDQLRLRWGLEPLGGLVKRMRP